jgi:hypothetical protein
MRARWILACALLGGATAAADPLAEEVDRAIRGGVSWLRTEQKADGAFGANPGETALALMALRHCGVPAADRACEKAARELVRALPDGSVYGAALGVLALLAQDPREHREEIAKLVAHLVRGQCRNGQWTYAYRTTARKPAGDNSNTQLAILALAAARIRRFDVPDETFARCHGFFAASQNADGGFGYAHNQRTRSYGSMTAGGAMALALCAAAGGAESAELPELARALAWLGRDFDASKNRDAGLAFGSQRERRGDAFWKHYWLWSLERAAAAASVDRVGDRDWYAEGARHLVDTQRDEGLWRDPERELQATCFALLFLSRSTRAVLTPSDVPVITPK